MNKIFNVDTDSSIVFTNKLEKLSRSAFPNAVRGTLNKLAFDVKMVTMPKEANDSFIERDKRFFKSQSRVDMAKGFSVSSMKSGVGFMAQNSRTSDVTIENLHQQEHGGEIANRKYIPVNTSRVSKSGNRKLQTKNRITDSTIKNIVRSSTMKGKSRQQQFVHAVHEAGVGGLVEGETRTGAKIIWRVNSLTRTRDGKFKLTPIWIVNDSKKIKIKRASHFMEKASIKSAKKGNQFYQKEAERQFEKYMK